MDRPDWINAATHEIARGGEVADPRRVAEIIERHYAASESYDATFVRCSCEGEVAFAAGKRRDDNPYLPDGKGTLPAEAWDDGWCAEAYMVLVEKREISALGDNEWRAQRF